MTERRRSLAAAEIPAAKEIVLASGPDDRRLRIIVDEDHVVSFAPPAVRVLQHTERDAHQVTAAARFHVDVVLLAVGIQQVHLIAIVRNGGVLSVLAGIADGCKGALAFRF